jgi:(1->4)-alpha-D-glucan 1-alpha-D-glucosylmutase
LCCRRDHPGLFTLGEYVPADALGERQENVCAFIRRQNTDCAIAVAPRLVTRLMAGAGDLSLGPNVWLDTVLLLPGISPGQCFRNIFTGEVLTTTTQQGQGCLRLADVFAHFPVALLLEEQ